MHRGLLVAPVAILLVLALENVLAVALMAEVGVPRALWIAVVEAAIFLALAAVASWRARSRWGHPTGRQAGARS